MNKAQVLLGLILVVIGALWIGQGLGYVGGSFMTGQNQWTWIGAATAAVGAVILLRALRRKP